jgi:hypothetical protein
VKVAARLLVTAGSAGKSCPSPTCCQARGIYPGVGFANLALQLNNFFAVIQDLKGSGTVILNQGKVVACDGGSFF